MNVARLEHLHSIIKAEPVENLDIGVWQKEVYDSYGGVCGTVQCFGGRACLDPKFNFQGLRLSTFGNPRFDTKTRVYGTYEALAKFFRIGRSDAQKLFNPDSYKNPRDSAATKRAFLRRLRILINSKNVVEV